MLSEATFRSVGYQNACVSSEFLTSELSWEWVKAYSHHNILTKSSVIKTTSYEQCNADEGLLNLSHSAFFRDVRMIHETTAISDAS